MPELAVDLGSPKFWVFFFVALLVLVPLGSSALKKGAFAALNLLFVTSLVGVRGAAAAIGIVVGVWLVARLSQRAAGRRLTLAAGGSALLALFLIHKLPILSAVGSTTAPLKTILAGVGFSFVMLRVVDVLRTSFEATQPAPGLVALVNYLLPFHALAAGPIQAYDAYVEAELVGPPLQVSEVLWAVERIASGLFKKFVLAQALQKIFLTGFEADGPYFFFEAQIYYVWVYLDFSAYSDIAVGAGRLLGVSTPENFDRPLTARNIIEFWERWHISLSRFIRQNVFIPLQVALMRRFGNASPLLIACVAFSIAFFLCGAWHGLNFRCLGWGAIHAVGLMACSVYKHVLTKRLGRKRMLGYLGDRRIQVLSTFATFEFVAFSLVFISYPFK